MRAPAAIGCMSRPTAPGRRPADPAVTEGHGAAPDIGVSSLAERARMVVSDPAWDYLSSGSGDNHTLRRNLEAWASLPLAPRMLVDVRAVDTRLGLLGHDLAAPLLIAPTAS